MASSRNSYSLLLSISRNINRFKLSNIKIQPEFGDSVTLCHQKGGTPRQDRKIKLFFCNFPTVQCRFSPLFKLPWKSSTVNTHRYNTFELFSCSAGISASQHQSATILSSSLLSVIGHLSQSIISSRKFSSLSRKLISTTSN